MNEPTSSAEPQEATVPAEPAVGASSNANGLTFPWSIKAVALASALHLISAAPRLFSLLIELRVPIYMPLIEFIAIVLGTIGLYTASMENRRATRGALIIALVLATPVISSSFVLFCPTLIEMRYGMNLRNGPLDTEPSVYYGVNLMSVMLLALVLWTTRRRQDA